MPPSPFLQNLRDILRRKHYSFRTEETYVYWTKDFIRFHRLRHPADMNETHVVEYLTHLAVDRRVAASTQNQALNAVVFLYKHVLNRPLGSLAAAARAKRQERLPVVFTRDEISALLDRLDGTVWLVNGAVVRIGVAADGRPALAREGSGLRSARDLRARRQRRKGSRDDVAARSRRSADNPSRQVRITFERDRERGVAGVYLPYALARKYPNAPVEWSWQWVFPSADISGDPRSPAKCAAIICNPR